MIYKIQSPDGQIHELEGPDGASDDDILSFAESQGLMKALPSTMQRAKDIEASDLPLEEAPLLSEANRMAGQGFKGAGVGLANIMTGKFGQAPERASLEVQGTMSNPTLAERIGSGVGNLAKPSNVLLGKFASRALSPLRGLLISTKTAGAGIGATERAAGVGPEVVDFVPPSKVPTFLRELQNIDPTKMQLQDARDTYAVLSQVINDLPKDTPNYAIANSLKANIGRMLNEQIPGRAEAAAKYATAKTMQGAKDYLKTMGKGAVSTTLRYGPLAALFGRGVRH